MEEQRYMWAWQIAEKWNVSSGWVCQLCREGRISGAFFRSGRWSIPADAQKPLDLRRPQNKVRRHRVRPNILNVPFRMGNETEELSKSLVEEIHDLASYATDYIDLSPASGRFLLAALAYPHVRAYAICKNEVEYRYLNAMKHRADEVYARVSIFMLEYFALGTSDRRAYFYEKADAHDAALNSGNDVEFVSLALFLCATGAGGFYACDENGRFCASHGRKKYPPTELEYENLLAISEALSSAEIFLPAERPFLLSAEDSFLLLHASKRQQTDESLSIYFKNANRVLLDEEN